MPIDSSLRAELIRKGNEAFNAGDYPLAKKLFIQASYKDGLVRLGDYYMYEKRLPLLAYGYYKKAGAGAKIQDIQRRMIGALSEWIGKDKIKPESLSSFPRRAPLPEADQDGMIPVSVSPQLKEAALKILSGK
ncbi:MAG: hypothetical protein OEZ34_17165 [Spirochaetia bacterium]|nr:hypothetical protein [Spirochaetia bacterium]